MSFDMASASSVQVVMVIEPLIQYSSILFPEGEANLTDFSLCAQWLKIYLLTVVETRNYTFGIEIF